MNSTIPAYRAISNRLIEQAAAKSERQTIAPMVARTTWIDLYTARAMERHNDAYFEAACYYFLHRAARLAQGHLSGWTINDQLAADAARDWDACAARVEDVMAHGVSLDDAMDAIYEGPELTDDECEIFEMMRGILSRGER